MGYQASCVLRPEERHTDDGAGLQCEAEGDGWVALFYLLDGRPGYPDAFREFGLAPPPLAARKADVVAEQARRFGRKPGIGALIVH